jgi:Rieske Fe-S protein
MPENQSCSGGCESGGDRREFLRRITLLAGAAWVGLGLTPRQAVAMPLARIRGARTDGKDVTYPLPAVDGAHIDTDNQVILVRHQGSLYAFALSCPHQNTALRWLEEDKKFQCPKHKSRYEADGTFITGRATRNMDRLPIRLEGKNVLVDADHVFESDKDGAAWAKATIKLS